MPEHQCILITGSAGFLGRYIGRYFFEQNWKVIGIDNSLPENAPLSNLTQYYCLKLPNSELSTILKKHTPDVLIHAAGRASVGLSITDPLADFYANSVLTFEILNSLRLWVPACRFIFLSSAAVYGNPSSLPVSENQSPEPISPYGFHKWQSEQLCLEFAKIYGLSTANVRIFSAYGPGLRRQVLWDICQKAITQKTIILQGTGNESRDFVHALDIVKALSIIATSAPMQGEVYNLANGQEVKISQVANMILNALDIKHNLRFDGIVPPGNPLRWQASISKLEQLGFAPSIPLQQGITSFIYWCRTELLGL